MKTTPLPPIYAAAVKELADRLEPAMREEMLKDHHRSVRVLTIAQAAGLCNMNTHSFRRRFAPWIVDLGLRHKGITIESLEAEIARKTPGLSAATPGGDSKV